MEWIPKSARGGPDRLNVVVGEIDDRWRVRLAFAPVPGFPLVEIRVFPKVGDVTGSGALEGEWFPDGVMRWDRSPEDRDRFPEEWHEDPPESFPVRKLHEIRLQDAYEEIQWLLERARTLHEEHGPAGQADRSRELLDLLPSLDLLEPEERLALVAERYSQLVEDPRPEVRSRPNAVLAEEWGRDAKWVTNEVYRARRRGFLSDPPRKQGKAGGTLQPEAREIVEKLRERTEEER